jgi:hypothetical protein
MSRLDAPEQQATAHTAPLSPSPAKLNDHDCKELIPLHWWEEKKSTAIMVLFE